VILVLLFGYLARHYGVLSSEGEKVSDTTPLEMYAMQELRHWLTAIVGLVPYLCDDLPALSVILPNRSTRIMVESSAL
jgi:hypothetical protein